MIWKHGLRQACIKWVLKEFGVKILSGFIWLRTGTSGGSCEQSSVSGCEFLVNLSDNQLLKRDNAPWS
jgi:hypothetical protein